MIYYTIKSKGRDEMKKLIMLISILIVILTVINLWLFKKEYQKQNDHLEERKTTQQREVAK